MSFGRRDVPDNPTVFDDRYVTRPEHVDLQERVRTTEAKLDRITWLLIATLAATLSSVLLQTLHP